MSPSSAVVLAIDIGGTKMAVGRVDGGGVVHARSVRPTPVNGTADELFASLLAGISEVGARDVAAVGVGCGGPMELGGSAVSPLNIPGWRGFPLRDRLAEAVDRPTFVDNDAKALALGEAWKGAAVGVPDFVALVVSTGVGGGIVLDGRLLDGREGNAGHIGHVIVEPEGRPCVCGARGCLEAEASGTAIGAMTGHPAAEATVEVRRRTGRLVGRAVASVAALLDLRLAVVAGSVALGFGDDFFGPAQDELDRSARIEHARGAVVRPGGLGGEGPLLGAAAVGWRGLGVDVGVR